jgi:hypothetical protein
VRQCREPANFLATGLAVSGRKRTCDGRASLVKPFQVTCGADVLDENVGRNWEGMQDDPRSKEARHGNAGTGLEKGGADAT